MNKSYNFLKEISILQKKSIPENVLYRAKQSLLDYVAVTMAGYEFQKNKIKNYIKFSEPEEGKYTAIGLNRKVALKEAVFLNGLNGHALDFDDGTNAGIIHLGSPIFSLLIPLAEKYKVCIDEMLRAVIIGYETSYTMAISIQPSHKALGYHATGTCGVLGATIAASYMLGFTEEERKQAFAIACISATGMLKVLDDGSELKPYNVAKTSLLALTSIQLAKAGFKGHEDPLGGYRGYFKMMTGFEDIEMKHVLQNGVYAIQKTYTKTYASCRYTHPAIEAAIYIKNNYNFDIKNIQNISIKTYDLAVKGHDHINIPNVYSAKMSIPYSTAVGLIYGKAGLAEFNEKIMTMKSVIDLTHKVIVNSDKELSSTFPERQIAILELTLNDGKKIIKQVDFPKGEPENPLCESEFNTRFIELMVYAGINEKISENIICYVKNNEYVKKILEELRVDKYE